jgi:hypothetical protein
MSQGTWGHSLSAMNELSGAGAVGSMVRPKPVLDCSPIMYEKKLLKAKVATPPREKGVHTKNPSHPHLFSFISCEPSSRSLQHVHQ